jgi:hypothetical protein
MIIFILLLLDPSIIVMPLAVAQQWKLALEARMGETSSTRRPGFL